MNNELTLAELNSLYKSYFTDKHTQRFGQYVMSQLSEPELDIHFTLGSKELDDQFINITNTDEAYNFIYLLVS